MSTEQDLMSCPFCGGKARLNQRVTESLWNKNDAVFSQVSCEECEISGQDVCDDPDGEEAIEWWNRRDPQAARQQAVPRLEPDEINQMAFEEGQPAEDGDGYLFSMEEFDLFVERLLSAHAPEPLEEVVKAILCREIGETSWFDHNPIVPGSPTHAARSSSPEWDTCPVFAAAPQAEQAVESVEAMQLAFELGGLEDGSYHLEADELERVIKAALAEAAPPTPDVSGLVEALSRLERASDRRAALLTSEAYSICSLIPGMDDALLELEDARKHARELLAAHKQEGA